MISTPTYRVFLIADPDDIELELKPGGRIELDVSAAPHVTADLQVGTGAWINVLTEYPDAEGFGYGEGEYGGTGYGGYQLVPTWTPGGEELLTALDPRETARIRIEVDVIDSLGNTQARTFDLGLRERPTNYTTAVLTLRLGSDEALLADWAPLADDTAPLALAGSLRSIVNYVLGEVIAGAELEASPAIDADLTPAPGGAEDDAFTWRAGQSALDFLRPLCQVAGYRLVCNEAREWTLRDENYFADGSTTVQYAVNMHDADETISRDSGEWFDAAVTRYRWTDSAGLEQIRVDAFATATPYTRLRLFERDTPYPGPGFSEYAVRRAAQRGREVNVTAAADWLANTEQSLTIALADAPAQTGLIESLTYELDTHQMTVSSRTTDTPDAAWLLIPIDEAWTDSPVGESWTEEVI
jgi:hypothetical protein